jgi:steroid 5-alpha reductase family enzyme
MLLQFGLGVLGAMAVVMVAAWAFGLLTRNGGWTDVFWTWGTGLTLAAAALSPLGPSTSPRQALVAGLMAVWMLRLGLYLTPRVAGHPEDARYAAFRQQWGARYPLNMLFVTLPQAPASALLGLSVIVAAHAPRPELGLRDGLAVALFGLAIAGETVADLQMKAFRDDPANRGQVMDRGLWGWSRHPNYFFQWLGWMAYPLIALDPARPVSWISLTAPAVMYGLLRYVSGVPPLEAQMLKSRGEAFRAYQARVSAFFPLPPKRVRSA